MGKASVRSMAGYNVGMNEQKSAVKQSGNDSIRRKY